MPAELRKLLVDMTISALSEGLGRYLSGSACVLYYAAMTGQNFLLLILINASFLAMPVFWLWIVPSILYVVLPQRTWGWMKVAVVRLWTTAKHRA